MNTKELSRKRFGRLIVIGKAEGRKNGCVLWNCRCDCGNEVIVPSGKLTSGRKKSCGCLAKEIASNIAKTGSNRRIHGMKHTKLYSVWNTMKFRCFNNNAPNFKDYGGRGITVCDEWKNSFQAFYDCVSKLPHFGEEGYSLDRINNDGNYEPDNVRWATRTEQNNNRRRYKNHSKDDCYNLKKGENKWN